MNFKFLRGSQRVKLLRNVWKMKILFMYNFWVDQNLLQTFDYKRAFVNYERNKGKGTVLVVLVSLSSSTTSKYRNTKGQV